jgi:hypothetical protein
MIIDALLLWGKQRGYPDLSCPPYAIGAGQYCWTMFCGLAKPEALQCAVSVVQAIDAQATATPDVHTIAAMLPSEQRQEKEQAV